MLFQDHFTFSRLEIYCGIIYHLLRRNLPHLWESKKKESDVQQNCIVYDQTYSRITFKRLNIWLK